MGHIESEEEAASLGDTLAAQVASSIYLEMTRKGITVADLAGRMGRSERYVYDVLHERKKNITLKTLARFAIALDTRVGIRLGD